MRKIISFVIVSSMIFGNFFSANSPWLIGATVFILALLLNPLRNRLQSVVDSVFFRGVSAYQQRVEDFSHELINTVDLSASSR